MREVRQLLNPTSYTWTTDSVNIDFNVPSWAVGAIFMLNVSAMAGTAETVDLKFQHLGPWATKDVLGASIVQLTAAATILITIDPRITAAANLALAQALTSQMRAVLALGGSTDETYTISLAAEFYS
jgi:hypothetical protein